MSLRRTAVLPLLVAIPLVANSSCRQLNPAFWDDVGSPATRLDEDSVPDESTDSVAPESTSTAQDTRTEKLTTGPATASDEASSSTSDSTSSTSTPDEASVSSGTTSTASQRWDAEGPAVNVNAGDADHCEKGPTTCFIMRSAADTLVASGTPGHEDIQITSLGVKAPSGDYPSSISPLNFGVRFDPEVSRVQTNMVVPVYSGQDFGIEIWYRTDPEPGDFGGKKMMLLQVHHNIWLHEWPDGGVSCFMPDQDGQPNELQHSFQAVRDGGVRDVLRYIACFIHDGQGHHFSNGVLHSYGTQFQGAGASTFTIPEDQTSGKIGVGGPVAGDADGEKKHLRFKGTIYMVRTWNNVKKLQSAMVGELKKRGLEYRQLEALQLD